MKFGYIPLGWGVVLTLMCGLPANAAVWKYVDKEGTLQFSSSPPPAHAIMIFDAKQQKSANVEQRDRTICVDSCKRSSPQWWAASPKYRSLEAHFSKAARTHGIDQGLLEAIAATESAFDSDAVSHKGAVGVMQVMPATARMYGVRGVQVKDIAKELRDPSTNIEVGASHLSRLFRLYDGRLELVVAAYNAGESSVARASNRVPNYAETKQYVLKVLKLYASSKAG